jgi:NADPH2:quinone reductase
MKAIRIHEFGGPQVLKYEGCPSPTPGRGQALINVQAIGVNFADVSARRGGATPPPSLPTIPGFEAAGVISAVGNGAADLKVGDTVVYWGVRGSYAEQAAVPVDVLVKMPAGLDAKTAAVFLQGMTAHYLAFTTCPLKPGDFALVHAGAGGTGLLLIQMAKRAGAYVFATVSTEEKAALAKEAGADKAIIYTREDFEEEVNKTTGGRGCQAVYDSVGQTTFEKSLNCLARRGCLALYGQSSGPVAPVAPGGLRGSSFLTRPSLVDHTATRSELEWRAGEVLSWVASGELKVRVGGEFPLAEAAEAHRQLEGRLSTGKLLLIP